MIAVASVWLGFVLSAVGSVALVQPLRFLGITNRRSAAAVLLSGLILAAIGFGFPIQETTVTRPESRLDELVPTYQFHERHSIHVEADAQEAYRAIRSVTANEIWLFQTLTYIRRFGRPGPESILDAPGEKPLLDVATSTSFLLLSEEPGREIVIGTLVLAPPGFRPPTHPTPEEYRRLSEPGFAKAVMNFRLEPDARGGTRLTTETRVFATDAASRRRFAAYWRIIYPGSALIRRMWLRAIRNRAETPEAVSGFIEPLDGDHHLPHQDIVSWTPATSCMTFLSRFPPNGDPSSSLWSTPIVIHAMNEYHSAGDWCQSPPAPNGCPDCLASATLFSRGGPDGGAPDGEEHSGRGPAGWHEKNLSFAR